MILEIEFAETNHEMEIEMGEVYNVSDESYKRGYEAGYEAGVNEPKPVGGLLKYVKLTVTPETSNVLNIDNPLGGIAKKVSVIKKPFNPTSKTKSGKFLADYDLGIGVGLYHDTSSSVLYTSNLTSGTVNNAQFKFTEGRISIYRYNAANTWDENSEYEVEIYE